MRGWSGPGIRRPIRAAGPISRRSIAKSYGQAPPRIASLAHDAVSLAIALSGGADGQRYTAAQLTRPSGFTGVDGAFRLLPDGGTDRALAILEVQKFGAGIIDAGPSLALRLAHRQPRAPPRRCRARSSTSTDEGDGCARRLQSAEASRSTTSLRTIRPERRGPQPVLPAALDETETNQLVHRARSGPHAADGGKAIEVQPLAQPQAHQEGLVGLLGAAEGHAFHHAVPVRLDALQPSAPAAARSTWHGASRPPSRRGRARRGRCRRTRRSASRCRLWRHSSPGAAWLEIS